MNTDAISLIIALFGVALIALACNRLYRARFLAATGAALSGVLLTAVGAVLFVVSLNLQTYTRLGYEQPVAELVFEQRGEQRYRATLMKVPSGNMQIFILNGDDWQLDARVLKWRNWVTMLGLTARYRLERVSGRYRDIAQEQTAPRSVYGLSENPGVDLWQLALKYPQYLSFVDAVYGSATYLPMADGARYQVLMTQSGLIARPINEAANKASKSFAMSSLER
jgi:hypothetical protein